MSTASPENQELARRLLAFEAEHHTSSDAGVGVAAQFIEELRLRLVKLAGVEGFRSLLSQALTLAKAEVPSLEMVQVGADGSLAGFDEIQASRPEVAGGQAGIVLVAHLLGLLMTFVGEPLTLSLLRDRWPEASRNGGDLKTEVEL
jgi:hypothetical protein